MAENFSTKTIISFTNIFVNMENFFNYIPIRDIAIERKNNRKKKKDAKDETLNILRHYMADDKAQRIFNEMQEYKKEDMVEKDILEIIKIR